MQRSELSGLSSRICVRREDCFIWPREGFTSRTLRNGIGLQETRGNWVGKTLNQCVQLKRKCRERRLMAWNGRAGPEACCLSAGKGCRGERGFLPERPWQEERRATCGCSCLPTARPGAALDSVAASGPGLQLYRVYMLWGVLKVLLWVLNWNNKVKCCIFDRSI